MLKLVHFVGNKCGYFAWKFEHSKIKLQMLKQKGFKPYPVSSHTHAVFQKLESIDYFFFF